jgi:hypothetical protein
MPLRVHHSTQSRPVPIARLAIGPGRVGSALLTAVAARIGVPRESVRKWRVRFGQDRVDGLAGAPRPGAQRKITDELVEVMVTRVLTEKGPGLDALISASVSG